MTDTDDQDLTTDASLEEDPTPELQDDDATEPEPADADSPETPDPEPTGDSAHIAGISGTDNTTIGLIKEIKDAHFHFESEYVTQLGGHQPQRLTRGQFIDSGVEETVKYSEQIVCDLDEAQRMVVDLERSRFVILAGEPELGKETLARYLAACLCQRHALQGVLRYPQSPRRELRIDAKMLFGGEKKRVVILKDAFQQQNADLTQLTQALDSYKHRLGSAESFVIFTSDTEKIPEGVAAWHGSVIEANRPSGQLLLSYLETTSAKLQLGKGDAPERLEQLFAADSERILTALNTIPRVQRFVSTWLTRVLQQEITLDYALDRASNLDRWLLEDRSADIETLAYALSMILCHAHPLTAGVPWFQFEALRQRIFTHLRRELRQHREAMTPEDLCREPQTLRQLEAEVLPMVGGGGDMVRFVKDQLPERLWNTLLGPGRRLLAVLTPLLDRLTVDNDFFLRLNAARAIGRFGQLDPYGIVLPRIGRWSRAGGQHQADALGALMQGVLGSEQPDFRKLCLGRFRQVCRSTRITEARTGILALRALAALDFDRVFGELRWVADQRLAPRLKELDSLNRFFKHFEAEVQRVTGNAEFRRAVNKELEKALYQALNDLFPSKREFQIFAAVQYTLVGLCFEFDAHRVVKVLKTWLPAGQAKLGPVLGLMFLYNNGIATVLERYLVEVSREDGGTERWSHFIYWQHAADPSMRDLNDFLVEIYLGIVNFPAPMRRALRNHFTQLLKRWARQACKGEECRAGVIMLLANLLEAPDAELRDEVFHLLQRDPDFMKHNSKLRELAAEVLITDPAV